MTMTNELRRDEMLANHSHGGTPASTSDHRLGALRRALRALAERGVRDYRHTPSMFGDANAPDLVEDFSSSSHEVLEPRSFRVY
jgi:hypothetical protein